MKWQIFLEFSERECTFHASEIHQIIDKNSGKILSVKYVTKFINLVQNQSPMSAFENL